MTCCRWVVWSGYSVSSFNNIDHHDIAEILLKVAINTITRILTPYILNLIDWKYNQSNSDWLSCICLDLIGTITFILVLISLITYRTCILIKISHNIHDVIPNSQERLCKHLIPLHPLCFIITVLLIFLFFCVVCIALLSSFCVLCPV